MMNEKCNRFLAVFFLTVAGSFFCAQALLAAEHPWKLRVHKGGITVHTRKVGGSAILEYKAGMIVDSPIDKAIALFEDNKKTTLWLYQCFQERLIEDEGPHQKIYYLAIHLPWPLADRDSVYRQVKSVDPVTGAIRYLSAAIPERLAKQKGRIRVPFSRSEWRFTPLPDGRTEIYLQQHNEAGGSIPAFIGNTLAADIPFHSFKNFRALLKNPK